MRSILKKFYFLLILFILLFSVVRLIFYLSSRELLRDNLESTVDIKIYSIKNSINIWYSQISENIILVEEFIRKYHNNPELLYDIICDFQDINTNIYSVKFYSVNNYFFNTKSNKLERIFLYDMEDEVKQLEDLLDNHKIITSLNKDKEVFTIDFTKKVHGSFNNNLGILEISSSVSTLYTFLDYNLDQFPIYSLITSEEGTVLYHSRLMMEETPSGHPNEPIKMDVTSLAYKIDREKTNYMKTSLYGNDGFLGYFRLPKNDWYIFVFVYKDFINLDTSGDLTGYVMIFVFPLLIFFYFAFMQKKYVLKPLTTLEKNIKQIDVEEDISYRLPLIKNDLFSPLNDSINHLLQDIEIYLKKIKKLELVRKAIFYISESVHNNIDINELYHLIHKTISNIMEANNFYIALYDRKKNLINFPYYVDQFDEVPLPYQPKKGHTEYVLKNGKPLLTNPEIIKQLTLNKEIELIGTFSPNWLGVPLIVNNETIGVMAVQSYTKDNLYGKEEKDILTFMSEQIAMAVFSSKAKIELQTAKMRLESLFEESPISLWEEDFSEVKIFLEKLKRTGIEDFDSYFDDNPEILSECLHRLKIIDVNKHTLYLYKCSTKKELFENINKFFRVESLNFLKKEIKAIYDNSVYCQGESVNYNFNGERMNLLIKWIVVPGYEESLKRVIIAETDITEQVNAYQELKKALKLSVEASDKLKKAQKELVESEQLNAIYAMAVTANHELNQPLMIIKGNLDMLKLYLEDKNLFKYINNIENALNRIDKTLSEFRKIENAKFQKYVDDTLMLDLDDTR